MSILIALAALAMIGFGMPTGVLSVAWPSMSDTFGVAITSLGTVVASYTVGYIISSFSSGWLLRITSFGLFLTFGAAVSGLGYVAFAFAPSWWFLLAVSAMAGAGHGYLDTGINLYAATRLSARATNWIHAFFGLGSLGGSSMMTGILLVGIGWEWGYGIVATPFIVLIFGFTATRSRWSTTEIHEEDESLEVALAGTFETLMVPGVWMGIAAFVLHTALEVAAAVWSFTLLTESRGLSVGSAGVWVTAYFGGLVAGRIALGTFADKLSLITLFRLAGVLSLLGTLLFWQFTVVELSFIGLVLLGFGLGPIFPTLVSATPRYVGKRHTQNSMGIQMGASAIGGGLLPAGVGILAASIGLEAVSVSLMAFAMMMLIILWIFDRFVR
ncbi:MAG: MFS transporter [Chloroflexi bacterium]|nr:MFS transporter [Chloroflexota bacterium]MBT3862955.1 MFS transporter [Chloroflexota bacterium]MBT4142951.1 MFS transporter [Chloroflexota bacterium]MBT4341685.1 MFS transporter [Chloroflexota bacterium]MBT4944105.1 MFS transporter [Chloroflexota bacterium]